MVPVLWKGSNFQTEMNLSRPCFKMQSCLGIKQHFEICKRAEILLSIAIKSQYHSDWYRQRSEKIKKRIKFYFSSSTKIKDVSRDFPVPKFPGNFNDWFPENFFAVPEIPETFFVQNYRLKINTYTLEYLRKGRIWINVFFDSNQKKNICFSRACTDTGAGGGDPPPPVFWPTIVL